MSSGFRDTVSSKQNLNIVLAIKSWRPYHWACNKRNTTGATRGAWTTLPSGAPEFTLGFFVGFVLLDL